MCLSLSLSFSLQLTLPLVEGLRSTAIRPRHWKQVLRFACSSSLSSTQLVGKGGGFDNTVLEHLTLSQLMALELHGQSYITTLTIVHLHLLLSAYECLYYEMNNAKNNSHAQVYLCESVYLSNMLCIYMQFTLVRYYSW